LKKLHNEKIQNKCSQHFDCKIPKEEMLCETDCKNRINFRK